MPKIMFYDRVNYKDIFFIFSYLHSFKYQMKSYYLENAAFYYLKVTLFFYGKLNLP
jgi:hypothetical protein